MLGTEEKMMTTDEMIMPWGAHRDKYVHQLPSSYLKYVAENWDEDTPFKKKLVARCDEEWRHREHYNTHFED